MPIDPVTKYAKSVLAGRSPACKYVRQACQRHMNDRKRKDVYFDIDQVEYVFKFMSLCKHIEGDLGGQPIELHPPQQFIIGSIFGWKWKESGLRKYQHAYIEVPRKNGKSTLLAPVALYMLAGDLEEGSQVYCAATKEKQAKIVWGLASKMVKKSKTLSKHCVTHWNCVHHPATNSRLEPLGADSDTQDGWNPHAIICDELHKWKGREYWDVLEDAFGARSQPLMLVITTAGYDKLGICYEQRQHCVNVLDPKSEIDDDRYFSYIATIDEEDMKNDDWEFDPKNWIKANPLLGVSKYMHQMENFAAKAKAMPGKLNTFINKQMNVWTDGQTQWLDMKKWDACGGDIDLERLKGEQCYAGMDLSSKTDITALVLLFPPGPYEEWTVLPFFYVPGDNVREASKRDKVPYDKWIGDGLIETTDGDWIDLSYIKRDYLELAKIYEILECGYDPWKATEIATHLENEGGTMVSMTQGHKTLFPGTSAIEDKIVKKDLRHGGNPVLRWMAKNTTTRPDVNDNYIPDKKNSYSRIDGISALINAMGRAIVAEEDQDPYKDRGIITI